jgi:hypothetical protein
VAALASWFFSAPASAGEEATTHRAGDLVIYRFACHDAESMTAIADRAADVHGGAGEIAAVLMEQGKCFSNPTCIAARLEAWVAGPYPPPPMTPRRHPGSVWRVRDQFGDVEFVWINDLGGRHPVRREMAL